MEHKYQSIYKVWDKSITPFTNTSDKTIPEEQIHKMGSLCCPGPFYYYVFSFPSKAITYVHENYEKIFGIKPNSSSVEIILSRIHPDDIEHFYNCEKTAAEFFYGIMKHEANLDWKISYQFRMKIADGSYNLFSHQAITLSESVDHMLVNTLSVDVDINHLTKQNNGLISFIPLKGQKGYYNIDPISPSYINEKSFTLSDRELEVIRLIADGLTTEEIANELFLSIHTITNHRQNAIKKTQAASVNDLIVKFVRAGVI